MHVYILCMTWFDPTLNMSADPFRLFACTETQTHHSETQTHN